MNPNGAIRHDVIVVGGGPAGSACAAGCARRGMRVALLDRARFPRSKVCGDFLNPKCWEVFERLGVAERVWALPHHESPGFLFSSLSGRLVQVEFARDIRRRHRSVAVSRERLDHCLLEHARSLGVDVREDATVVGLERIGTAASADWIVETRGRAGRDAPLLRARCLVGADGRHSFVGRRAGLLRRETADSRVGVQFIVRVGRCMSDCVQLHQLPGGYCGAVKIGEGLANVCLVTGRRSAARVGMDALRANPVLADLLAGAVLEGRPRSITPILGADFRACGKGVVLAGDAARVIEPFTGQGVYFALRSGEWAAEAVAEGRQGDYEEVLDAEYRSRARANRVMREVIWRGWAMRGAARIAEWRPQWMESIVQSVIQ